MSADNPSVPLSAEREREIQDIRDNWAEHSLVGRAIDDLLAELQRLRQPTSGAGLREAADHLCSYAELVLQSHRCTTHPDGNCSDRRGLQHWVEAIRAALTAPDGAQPDLAATNVPPPNILTVKEKKAGDWQKQWNEADEYLKNAAPSEWPNPPIAAQPAPSEDIVEMRNLVDRAAKILALAGTIAQKDSINPLEAFLWDARAALTQEKQPHAPAQPHEKETP
jgi:hypothetical protein